MKLLLVLTASLLGLAASSASQASVSTTALIGQNNYTSPEIHTDCAGCVTSLAHTDNYLGYTGPSHTTVTEYAMADYGVLKAASTTEGSGDSAYTIGYARASFDDTFRIDAPGMAGQRGYFTAVVTMPYVLTTENPIYSDQYLFADIGVTSLGGHLMEKYQLSAGDQSLFGHDALLHNGLEIPFATSMLLTVEFFYGEPLQIESHLNTSMAAHTNLSATSFSAVLDASHSLIWQGISSLTDAAGHPITAFSVTSDSGTDWSRNLSPVPEPGAALLMLVGLCVLTARVRSSSGGNDEPTR